MGTLSTIQHRSFFDYTKDKKIIWNNCGSCITPVKLIDEVEGLMLVVGEGGYYDETAEWYIGNGLCENNWRIAHK